MIVVPDAGMLRLAQLWRLSVDTPSGWSFRLFKTNYTPVSGSVLADFTIADFQGYANVSREASDFSAASFSSGVAQFQLSSAITWTKGAGGTSNTIYGVYVVDGGGKLLFAERFSSPQSMTSTGETTTYQLALQLQYDATLTS